MVTFSWLLSRLEFIAGRSADPSDQPVNDANFIDWLRLRRRPAFVHVSGADRNSRRVRRRLIPPTV
jgi:hypothetical protein